MLVLSRKPGEKVRIGSDITVVVLEVRGNLVRMGIDAPAHVSILRHELCESLIGGSANGERQGQEMYHAVGYP